MRKNVSISISFTNGQIVRLHTSISAVFSLFRGIMILARVAAAAVFAILPPNVQREKRTAHALYTRLCLYLVSSIERTSIFA